MAAQPSENPRAAEALNRARQACTEAGFADTSTPLVDGWMSLWKSGGGSPLVVVNSPTDLFVAVERWGQDVLMATVRIAGVRFQHRPEDMRLLLMAALEWLDFAESEYDALPCTDEAGS